MIQNSKVLNGNDFYILLDKYRAVRKTSALTTYDIQPFIEENPEYQLKQEKVLKHIIMGNACAWRPYNIAHEHYESIRNRRNVADEY